MCLHYMMDIETHTVIYLRDLLAPAPPPTADHRLPPAGLRGLWHGEAFSDFLARVRGPEPIEPRLPDGRTPLPTTPTAARPAGQARVGNGLGIVPRWWLDGSPNFIAIHMMWGAVNELTTLTAYYALSAGPTTRCSTSSSAR